MDASEISALQPALDRYLAEFDDCFGRVEPATHFGTYVAGQLSDLPRKSIEPIALKAGTPPRTLQQFLSGARWQEGMMRDRLQEIVARDHAHPHAVGIFDETSYAKKGDKTPGVKRQHCGSTGKTDNCCVSVHLGYATPDGFHALLDGELFLPEDWSADRQRCCACGIPHAMVHRTKGDIALELRDRAVANGVRFPWMTFDEGYGQSPAFLHALDDRGQLYVAEVPRCFTGWCKKPPLLHKQHHAHGHGPNGRPRTFPRLAAAAPRASAVEDLCRYSPVFTAQPWQAFHVKDTTRGPVVWRVKAAPFHLKRDGLPTRCHWLIIAQNALNEAEVKYFVSNAPPGTPLEVMLHVAFSRWPIERCFQDQKTELGLDHFEVRNYRSLMRHLILTAVSFLFLAKTTHQRRGEKSGPDALPSPRRRKRDDPIAADAWAETAGISAPAG
jgi:SRSO17 transposase